jgi:hypothetical protein
MARKDDDYSHKRDAGGEKRGEPVGRFRDKKGRVEGGKIGRKEGRKKVRGMRHME